MVNIRSKDLLRLKMELVKSRHLSAIGTLAATVAHELRNPLAHINISIHRIKKTIQNPLVEEILNDISARVLESDQIIKDILMYSKSTMVRYTSVKINDILRHVIDEEINHFPIGKIIINEKIDHTRDLIIEADPVRIKEVFLNILHNALDAVDTDTGIIEIESDVKDSMLSLVVKDNGEGIAKRDLKNVLSPFFTTKIKGTGLGLAVCKQVVMLHKGSLTIESTKGKGTTVVVKLPVHKQKNA